MGASDFSKLPHIGESLRRKEDYRFLTGAGQYTDDVQMANMTHAYFVRSPHAHAHIKSIDIKAALAAPGVIGIFDGKDVAGDSINGLPCGWLITDTSGQPMKEPAHPILAQGKVRYVGDHVAMVVAVDQLVIGSKVTVRIMAGNQRTMPDVAGVLTRISADLTRDSQTNQVYYVVRVSLDEEQVRGLHDLTLVPGMPAEAFIQTQERTPLQYLLGPLSQQIARTFRER